MLVKVTRRIEWDAAHRVMGHESKCGTLHGHRYVALVECSAAQLDGCDRVIDFGVVKELVGGWVDEHWDHTTLVNIHDHDLVGFTVMDNITHRKKKPYTFDGEPTAETIAISLLGIAQKLLDGSNVVVESVTVFETPNCSARVERTPKYVLHGG